MTCDNARDTITQSAGKALDNHYDYPDSNHVVTSYCRGDGGTWVGWYNRILGDGIDAYDFQAFGDDTLKANWPSLIASATAIGVGFFPGDEASPATVYELGIDPVYGWNVVGITPPSDPCSVFPFLGDVYAPIGKAQLASWGMDPIDVQVRTDGTNVWVVALACESVKYPYLYNSPTEVDACGVTHSTFENYWLAGHSDPFFHDWDAGNRWWIYANAPGGGSKPYGDYDDPGWSKSFRWQPARVTVWAGDLGGFTRLDTIEAQYDNYNFPALCGPIEAAASSAEPGVLHLLWSEAGNFGPQTHAPMRGQRINYSRWSNSGKELDTDLFSVSESGSGYVSDAAWVWTGEYILRNEHGSPAAIVWPWVVAGGPQYVSPAAQYWDLSSGSVDVLQTLDISLTPTNEEGGYLGPPEVAGQAVGSSLTAASIGYTNIRRSQFASTLYSDPLLDGTDVYLLSTTYSVNGQGSIVAFYRIPADGSDTFSFMDGTREVWYSIIPRTFRQFGLPWAAQFLSDFISDPDNVWVPTGSDVTHLDRQCLRFWEILPAFPENSDGSGYLAGAWTFGPSPPAIVTDEAGDWLYGGGNGPQLTILSVDHSNIAALKAKICRCCLPCIQHQGMHIWFPPRGVQKVS